ncbi:MAG: histidine kinase dimerization/phospho-acceptor domain-containing protein, partial [Smithellaceae bacterium]|nr:histidine kinase dimerization/phospho-acceptor domain-containing protein [Smithellaceae bacterium]
MTEKKMKTTDSSPTAGGKALRHRRMTAQSIFTAGIGHELNNVLGSIIGYTELALYGLPEEDKTLKFHLETVLKASSRAKKLIKQLMEVSRGAGELPLEMPLDIFAKETLKDLRRRLPRIKIDQDLSAVPAVVMTNPERLCEALDVIMAILDEIQETENVTFRLREGEEESSGFVTISVEKMSVGRERYLKILECLQGVPSHDSAQMG